MKSTRKLVVLLGLLCLLSPLRASAQQWADSMSVEDRFWNRSGGYARQLALASGGFGMLADTAGLKTLGVNPYAVDPLFMLTNPAYASHYRSYIWFDLGLSGSSEDGGFGQEFGGTFSLSDNITAGLILGRSDAAGYSLVNPRLFGQISPQLAGLKTSLPANTWEVFGALHSGGVDVGLALSYLSSPGSTTGTTGLDSTSRLANITQLGFSGGLLLRADDGMMFDLGLTALMPKATSGTTAVGELSVSSFAVNARAFIPLHKEFYLVPIANVYLSSGTSTFLLTPKDLPGATNIDAGVGVNFWQSGVHIMSGVSFGSYKETTPSITSVNPALTKTQTIFPRWNIGAEWPALKWLTVRMGYFGSNSSETRSVATSTTTSIDITQGSSNLYSPLFGSSSSGVTLGAAFQIGNLSIDATINDATARGGIMKIFGSDDFGFVTLGYRFD